MINRSPWLWGARKTAAGLTARTSLGLHILQGKRAPGQSNPSLQYLQSQAMAALLNPLYQQNRSAFVDGFTNLPAGWSAFTAFWHYAQSAVDKSAPPDVTLNPLDLTTAHGSMTPTPFASTPVASAAAQTVIVAWPTSVADETQRTTDRAIISVFNTETGKFIGNGSANIRSTGTSTLTLPPASFVASDNLVVYLAFVAESTATNNGTSSDSNSRAVVAGA